MKVIKRPNTADLENELRTKLDEISAQNELLKLNNKRYICFIEDSKDIIYSCDLRGIILSANKSFCKIFAKAKDDIIGKDLSRFLQFEDPQTAWDNIIFEIMENRKTIFAEYAFKMSDGSIRCHQVTLSPIIDEDNRIIEILGTNHDITMLKSNEQKIMALAYRDSLTNLPNKNLFLDRLKTSILTSRRNGTKVSVIMLDLDDYKIINNAIGYYFGDKILIETAKRVVSCMRDYDTVARLSEDKFLLLLQDIQVNELSLIIARINSAIQETYKIKGSSIKITASIGVSVFPEDGTNAEEILINADKALNKAKELGKNRCYFYNDNINLGLERKNKLETMLKNALANNEFFLHYQPQYEARTRRLRGFEALIRWNNPEIGVIMPREFIPYAEETGLIMPIGKWVLETACQVCANINKKYDLNLNMSINISEIQLKHKGFSEVVISSISNSGIEPANLELEVSEGSLIGNFDSVVSVLKYFKDMGIRITLSDFGSGNLALSYLKKLPINMVKLDKEFINEIDHAGPQGALTESIISLVHKLNIEMLAGGVENKEQFDFLIKGKCDNIQGYFFEEPVPEEFLDRVIKNGILENEALSKMIQKAGLTYEGFVKQKMQHIGLKWDTKL